MTPVDAQALAALGRRLGRSPRQVLVAAARLAQATRADGATSREILAAVDFSAHAGAQVAALLLTPIASFALDETDAALASLWPRAEDAT